MNEIIHLDHTSFTDTLSRHDTVVVDFWAPWCAPCNAFAPIYEAATERHRDVVFAKVNVDEAPEVVAHQQIRAIPTLRVFRTGDLVASRTGSMAAAQLDKMIAQAKGP